MADREGAEQGGAPDAPAPDGGGRFRLVLLGGLSLLRPDGREDPSLGARGRKLVLLAYIALSPRPMTRDRLATFLWGHRDDEHARHSLRDALSSLRQTLGTAIPRGRDMVMLGSDAPLDVDVAELRAAARCGDHARVVSLYRGPFLDGVYISDAEEVEHWIAAERRATERTFVAACVAECGRLTAAGEFEACAALTHRWMEADPTDSAALLACLNALAALGTSSALREALATYDRQAVLLAHVHDESPSATARQLREELAVRLASEPPRTVVTNRAATLVAASEAVEAPVSMPELEPSRARFVRRALAATVLLATAGTMLAAVLRGRHVAAPTPEGTVVVAGIESSSRAPEDRWLEDGLARLLTSALVREQVPGVVDPQVVRTTAREARMADSSGRTDAASALVVARRLHATTLLSGEITRGGGRLLLDLAIRDVATGALRRRVSVNDTSLAELIEHATARVLPSVEQPGSRYRLDDVETSSIEAYRAYRLAMTRLDAGHLADGVRLLDVAIASDSTFIAALQQRMLLIAPLTDASRDSLRRLTVALARLRAQSDFDRRATAIDAALRDGDRTRTEQLARELAARYPRDVRAQSLLVAQLLNLGDYSGAHNVAVRVIADDSEHQEPGVQPCATCALYGVLVSTALASADGRGASATARKAVARDPLSPAAWSWLSRAELANGHNAQSVAAAERAVQLAPREESAAEALGWLLLETRRFGAAESLIQSYRRRGSELAFFGRDLGGALLRERGQYHSAARAYELAVSRPPTAPDSAAMLLVYGSSLAYAGELGPAVRAFERAAHGDGATPHSRPVLLPTYAARAFVWPHTLLADALFLGGSRDTLLLSAIADSIEDIGLRSVYGRDRRLHFHVRGLIAEIGGRWGEAERAFQRAKWGQGGWTRTNVELARAQNALGRPAAAIISLRDVRFGTLDGMGRYAPRTEIDAALAETFLGEHLPDSARVYVERVRTAWSAADAPQRRRLAAMEERLTADHVAARRTPTAVPAIGSRVSLRTTAP